MDELGSPEKKQACTTPSEGSGVARTAGQDRRQRAGVDGVACR